MAVFGSGKLSVRLVQVLLWIVFYLLLLIYTSHKWSHPLFGFFNSTIATLSYIIAVYVHAFWLLPKLLHKNKNTAYFISSFLFIVSLVLLRMWIEKEVLLPIHQKFYAFQWSHASFTTITLLVAFLFGALLRVLFNYLNLLQVKKELQSRQAETELNLLKAQVQPHFLFNTLNNIYSLAQSRSEKTPEMIARLSELMRYFIDEAPRQQVMLSTDLSFIKNYSELEQIRMLNPVIIEWKIDETLLKKPVPPMLLMPFVENVFKHGIDKLRQDNSVTILLQSDGQWLVYRVSNPICDEVKISTGSGLLNLKKRLELLYPGHHTIQTKKENGQYIAELRIPI